MIALRDETTGSSAEILPNLGFNCFRFTAMHERPIDVLWSEEGFASGARRASGSGIPILFPFPGRIAGTSLDWRGRRYALEAGDGRGNAIHGFVLNRPWRVLESSATHAVGQFHASRDDAALENSWPGDFRITLTIRLAGNELSLDAFLENPGESDLPMGFGVHPYFRVPLGGNDAGGCRVQIPAAEYWELKEMLATGRKLPAAKCGDVAGGMAFAETQLDDVFTSLEFAGEWSTASVADPASGRTLQVAMDRGFRECVVYNPPHREAICIEPYTCVPGAIDLAERSIDAGLQILKPGESRIARVRIALL